ncbi:MAG: hypothetical protein R2823_07670 [Acidimicrobiia bacterium]
MRIVRTVLVALVAMSMIAAVAGSAFGAETGPGVVIVATQETTEATTPDTTTPPTTTVDAETPDATETPWWILVMVGFLFVILVASFVARGRKSTVVVASPSAPTWKDHARAAYADARWLYDAMAEDTALWRGNAQFAGTTEVGDTAGTGRAETWRALSGRFDRVKDRLYALEASAPDRRTAETARAAVEAMLVLRDALDARAESRYRYRVIDADPSAPPSELGAARDREVRASVSFNTARAGYAEALTALSGVI